MIYFAIALLVVAIVQLRACTGSSRVRRIRTRHSRSPRRCWPSWSASRRSLPWCGSVTPGAQAVWACCAPDVGAADGRLRARGLGIPLPGDPGPLNAITDVAGVEVGTVTLIEGDGRLRVGHGRCAPASPRSCRVARRRRPPVCGGLVLAQRQRRDDGHHVDRGVRSVQSACRAVEYARRRGLPHRCGELGEPGQSAARAPVAAPGVRGDVGRLLNDINGGHVRPEHVEAALDAAVRGRWRRARSAAGPG